MMYAADGAPIYPGPAQNYQPSPGEAGSVLRQRIVGENYLTPMQGLHPAGTEQTPHSGPLARVVYDGANVLVDDLHPIYAAGPENAPIPATGSGQWGQVVAAGRR